MLKNKKEVNRKRVYLISIILLFLIFIQLSFVSAGVGIKWDKESVLVNEGEKTCLTYSVYNPWPEETNVMIEISDDSGELNNLLIEQESETKLIPANTPSDQAIPLKFCFKTPIVYKRDCWIGDSFICKQECNEEQKTYTGEVVVKSIPSPIDGSGGSGGSSTTMSVSAPLNIRISCNAHERDFTLLYILIAIISAIIIAWILINKYRKPKIERDKEELKKLQEKIKKEKNK